jgi:GAF domain-containing protein/HAMP domain-containing protein
MRLKTQITLLIAGALLTPVLLISAVAIFSIHQKANSDIRRYHQEELDKLKVYLKHLVDIAYGAVEHNYKQAQQAPMPAPDSAAAGGEASPANPMAACLRELASLRFDRGEGYFWVTDNSLPYPRMVMHAEKAGLAGKVLDDPKFNVAKATGANIYQARVQLCNATGEGFTEYVMKKPGSQEVISKLSYSRLYAPLGWVISTGIYTDQIERAVAAKEAELTAQLRSIVGIIGAASLVILAGGLVLGLRFSNGLVGALTQVNDRLRELAAGKPTSRISHGRQDEIGEMTTSLNTVVTGLHTYSDFARHIGRGNLAHAFEPLSREDNLGNELMHMRDSLQKAAAEKSVRDWTTEGVALFGELLRKHNTDAPQLCKEVIRGFVKYLDVNQGALFLPREDDGTGVLERVATYAYNRTKYITSRVAYGQGLVGQCVLEKETIYLAEVPADYVHITSGLGEAPPRSILVVPLLHNGDVYGVLEMASFRAFAPYQVAFVEKVAESIAGALANIAVNDQTRRLLEQSQQLAHNMKTQEEELRQNQEELQATQEEMRRRQEELERENETLRKQLQTAG